MSKKVLIIAYSFPPNCESTGYLRTVSFVRYMKQWGWTPIVLTVKPEVYNRTLQDPVYSALAEEISITRCSALSCKKHFSVAGKYPGWIAMPDDKNTWIISGAWHGAKLIKQYKPDLIWSTYPIYSSMLIAKRLSKKFKIPWIADFRDPMWTQFHSKTLLHRKIDKAVIEESTHIVTVTHGMKALYCDRYPQIDSKKISVVHNGYNEMDFTDLGRGCQLSNTIHLLHSGLLDREIRDPTPLFRALQALKHTGFFDRRDFQVVLRCNANEKYWQDQLLQYDISDLVTIKGYIPRNEALIEQKSSHGLLLLQGQECATQIPAKVYEYLRIGRPIFALVPEQSDIKKLLSELGYSDSIASISETSEIKRKLISFIEALESNKSYVAEPQQIQRFDREKLTYKLCNIFDQVAR